jgi:protein phosphatase
MDLQYYGWSEKGKRDNNEDAFLDEKAGDYWIFAIADGLGGHQTGEQASAIALKILHDEIKKRIGDPKASLEKIAYLTHNEIQNRAALDRKLYGMATTLVAPLMNSEGKIWIMNIRDSPAYLIGEKIQHTRDHSIVDKLFESGEITRDDARRHPVQTVILQTLGDPESNIQPDFYETDILDVMPLLSTDGLHDSVDKETIREIVSSHGKNLSTYCDALIKKALNCGSKDNITLVIVKGS